MARFKVIDGGFSLVAGVVVYSVMLQPDGGTIAQSLRATGPAGSQIAAMKFGEFYNLNQQAGRYRVAGFAASEVTIDGVTSPIYSATFRSTAPGSTPAHDVRVTGPAGSQIATEAMRYGYDFDFIPS